MTVPKRRWFAFTLRTMFVAVTVFGGWLGYELNWIRQRRAFIAREDAKAIEQGRKKREKKTGQRKKRDRSNLSIAVSNN